LAIVHLFSSLVLKKIVIHGGRAVKGRKLFADKG
jgi:hypothetical protein